MFVPISYSGSWKPSHLNSRTTQSPVFHSSYSLFTGGNGKMGGFEGKPGFQSRLHHFPAESPGPGPLSSRGLHFPSVKWGTVSCLVLLITYITSSRRQNTEKQWADITTTPVSGSSFLSIQSSSQDHPPPLSSVSGSASGSASLNPRLSNPFSQKTGLLSHPTGWERVQSPRHSPKSSREAGPPRLPL